MNGDSYQKAPRFGVTQGRRGVAAIGAEIAGHWRAGDPTLRAVLAASGIAGAGLAGAAAFGFVHVVGGAWHGNPRAVGFGIGLATASTWLLAGLAVLIRTFARRRTG